MARYKEQLALHSKAQDVAGIARLDAQIKQLQREIDDHERHKRLQAKMKPYISDFKHAMVAGEECLAVQDYGGLYAWSGLKFFVFCIVVIFYAEPGDDIPTEDAYLFFGEGFCHSFSLSHT